MEYFLGIDQGGSKTAAVVGDGSGRILGIGYSHGSCYSEPGMLEDAMNACAEAAENAAAQAGIDASQIGYLCGGITGIDWEGDGRFVEEQLGKRLGIARIRAVNDCIIAMRAGTSAPNRAVICAGSGLNCAVHTAEGEVIFGFYIPDEYQGGAAIGRAALQKVFDAEAGVGIPTALKKDLLQHFQAENVDQLLKKYVEKRISYAEILALPPIVEQETFRGDQAASDIFRTFAEGVVPYLISGMKKMGVQHEPVDVVLSGSVFKCKASVLKDTIRRRILEAAEKAVIIDAEFEPVIGAYLSALDDCFGEFSLEKFRAVKSNCRFNITRQ